MPSTISKETMKPISDSSTKTEMIRIRRANLKRLPGDVAGIERWIKAIGGHRPGPAERARLKKHGLIGMPSE